jgi:hypothetical protein
LSSKLSKLAFYFDKKFNKERHCTHQYVLNLFVNVQQISFLYFNNIGLMQCSQTLSVISSADWEKNHWSHETSLAFWVWARFAGSIFILPNTARSWYSVQYHTGGLETRLKTISFFLFYAKGEFLDFFFLCLTWGYACMHSRARVGNKSSAKFTQGRKIQ